MTDLQAQKVAFAGHGSSDNGRFGVFLFNRPNGEPLPLAVPVEHLPALLKAVAAAYAEANKKLGEGAVTARPIPIERWKTTRQGDTALLSLTILGDVELEFVVTRDTIREDAKT